MSRSAQSSVRIQISAESALTVPIWFGEIPLLARQQILEHFSEQVRLVVLQEVH